MALFFLLLFIFFRPCTGRPPAYGDHFGRARPMVVLDRFACTLSGVCEINRGSVGREVKGAVGGVEPGTYKACYLAQKLCFWTGIIFIGVYVSVCECLYDLSQKVPDRF